MTLQSLKKHLTTRPNSKRRTVPEPGNLQATANTPYVTHRWGTYLFAAGVSLTLSGLISVDSSRANSTGAESTGGKFSAVRFAPVNAPSQESELQWQRPTLDSTALDAASDATSGIPTHPDTTVHLAANHDSDRADSLYDESLWSDENSPEPIADIDEDTETFAQSSIELVSTTFASTTFTSSDLVEHGGLVESDTGQTDQHLEEDRSIRVAVWDDPFDNQPNDDSANDSEPNDLFEEPLIEESDDSNGQDENLDPEPNLPEFEPAEEGVDSDWEPDLPQDNELQNNELGPKDDLPSAPDQIDSGSNSPPSTLRTIESDVPDTTQPSDRRQPREETPLISDRNLEDFSAGTAEVLPEEIAEEDDFEDSLSAQEFAESRKNCAEELAQLTSAHIDSIDLNIRVKGKPGKDFPYECTLDSDRFSPRSWPHATYLWKASGLCHKPLYFEQVQLERYGHSWGPYLQPLVSGAHFFATVPILPYKMGLKTPTECVYSLGYYRPGSCAPYLLDPVPFTWRAAMFETAFIGGAIGLIP
ncbi:MAG: hypothetical protein ABGX16_09350 [Pirellulales bacterium]